MSDSGLHLPSLPSLPSLTGDLAGIGGVLSREQEDFRVVEIPAYEPSGEGDHILATIEKRGLTTFEAVQRIADALDVRAADIGTAGLKDRHAVTVQSVSLPPPTTPEQVLALQIPDIAVLSAARHGNKLRTGHLRGNRFQLRVRELACDAALAADRARAILAELARAPGSPNWYGRQRFGARSDNAALGRALVLGELKGKRAPRGRKRRLLISAFQSQLFNEFLEERIRDGLFRDIVVGDVLQKTDSRGVFVCQDPSLDLERMRAGEVVATGPMFGPKMKPPLPESPADARERRVLERASIELLDFARVGKLALGTRRSIAVSLGKTDVREDTAGALTVTFELPAGAYATAVMSEIMKGPQR